MTLEEENDLLKRRVAELEAPVNSLKNQLQHANNPQVDAMLQLTRRIQHLEECIMRMGQQR